MITTYVLTFNSSQKFDEFITIVNNINTGKYTEKNAIRVLSIDALMYDSTKNNYICIFNVDGKILNNNILRIKFDLITYLNHPDKNIIYRALCKNTKFTDVYHTFDNYNDMFSHYNLMLNLFPLLITKY